MAIDTQAILGMIIPWVQVVIYGLFGMVVLGGTYYYLFYIVGRKKWHLRIYELPESGKLRLRGFDILQEKKVLGGKRLIYWLKNARVSTIPPSADLVQSVGKKDYVDYIRIDTGVFAAMPTEKLLNPFDENHKPKNSLLQFIDIYFKRKDKLKTMRPEDIRERFIYVPADKAIKLNLTYNVSYDVDMMRMNAIDLRDLMWQGTQKFWEKYGTLIVAGAMLICIIAIAVLSYEHVQKTAAIGAAQCGEMVKQGIIEGFRHTNISTPPS